jgi:hypothetical protein
MDQQDREEGGADRITNGAFFNYCEEFDRFQQQI